MRKRFDCVAAKHRAILRLNRREGRMTFAEECKYWKRLSD